MSAVFDTDEEAEKQYNRLRRDVGANDTVISNELAEEYFVESQERYTDNTAKMIAYARVIAIRAIRASAAMLGKYAQNQSQSDYTKVFDNLTKMLDDAIKLVESESDPVAEADRTTPFAFGVATGRRGQ